MSEITPDPAPDDELLPLDDLIAEEIAAIEQARPELAGFATLAERLARLSPRSGRATADLLLQLEQVDIAVYIAIARTPTPALDRALRHLSNSANRSRLWVAIAAGLALAGGQRGRRAALGGILSVGAASVVANLGVKPIAERSRPERDTWEVPSHRHVHMPESRSFPSGHSASAFAFATGVGQELPFVAPPLYALAALVAYSRTHTGVHFPGDVVIGSLLGITTGQSGPLALRFLDARRARRSG